MRIEVGEKIGSNDGAISYTEAQNLPYLQAVIKESLRLCPPVGMLLERQVPPGGLEIEGFHFREGEVVGMNPWTVGRNPAVFADPEKFRPERWLEADGQALREMGRSLVVWCRDKDLYRQGDFSYGDLQGRAESVIEVRLSA